MSDDTVRWAVRLKDGRWLDAMAVATTRWSSRHLFEHKVQAIQEAFPFRRHHGARVVRIIRRVKKRDKSCRHCGLALLPSNLYYDTGFCSYPCYAIPKSKS